MKYSIFDIARYIIESNGIVSHKKLQKLCYYVYSWYIYLYNESEDYIKNRLFCNDFEAWVHGPVSVSLYKRLKPKRNIFEINVGDLGKRTREIENTEITRFIDSVLKVYFEYSAEALESISHQESPWLNQRKGLGVWENSNNRISDQDIFREYAQRQKN